MSKTNCLPYGYKSNSVRGDGLYKHLDCTGVSGIVIPLG